MGLVNFPECTTRSHTGLQWSGQLFIIRLKVVKKHNKKPNQGTEKREMLAKCPTGIRGLDELTEGGIPKGSPTLVCGPAGTGKTLLGIEFIIRGATQHQEPGVYISFEEPTEKIARNIRI